jgi:hypothetical protein
MQFFWFLTPLGLEELRSLETSVNILQLSRRDVTENLALKAAPL